MANLQNSYDDNESKQQHCSQRIIINAWDKRRTNQRRKTRRKQKSQVNPLEIAWIRNRLTWRRYVIQIANGAINCLQGLPIAKAAHTASIDRARNSWDTYRTYTHTHTASEYTDTFAAFVCA